MMKKTTTINELKEKFPDIYDVFQDNPDGSVNHLGKMSVEDAMKIPNVMMVHKTGDSYLEPVYISPDFHINNIVPELPIEPITVVSKNNLDFTKIFKTYQERIVSSLMNFNSSVGK